MKTQTFKKEVKEATEESTSSLQATLYKSLAESEGNLYIIKEFPINDDLRTTQNGLNFTAFAVEKIKVQQLDFVTKPGHARVNDELDVPLVDERPLGRDSVYWSEQKCSSVVNNLNRVVLEKVRSQQEELAKVQNFLERLITIGEEKEE